MRSLVFAFVALLALAAVPAAHGATTVTVTLQVGAGGADWRDCSVSVPAGSNVGTVLDQAVADGCILEWQSASYPGYGRYVTSIDFVHDTPATYWAFYVDSAYANLGIDDTSAQPGATYSFQYEQWLVPM